MLGPPWFQQRELHQHLWVLTRIAVRKLPREDCRAGEHRRCQAWRPREGAVAAGNRALAGAAAGSGASFRGGACTVGTTAAVSTARAFLFLVVGCADLDLLKRFAGAGLSIGFRFHGDLLLYG